MTNSWKSDYLLNIVLVSRCDGELRPSEVIFIAMCKEKVMASDVEFADAVIRAQWEDCCKTGSLIADEMIVKDMIQMAIIDGKTHDAEEEMVYRFIDQSKIPKYRVRAIIKDAVNSINQTKERAKIYVGTDRL